jgi:DNA-binding SARP family transcriptional activator
MRLSVLGPPELVRTDGSSAGLAPGKTLAVLVYLAHATSPPSRAELARLFWPNSEPSKARHSVRQTLSLLRKVVGE